MPVIGELPELNLKTIVYATDFSSGSEMAGYYAARMAAYFSATLIVAHAFTLSQAAMEVESNPAIISQQRKDLKALLATKAALLGGKSVQAVPSLLDGDPKDAIPALAEKQQPSIVVLGTHGRGRVEREIIGSTAEQILRSTRWPTLTVGPRVQTPSLKAVPFERMLFATDFTPAAANAAWYAINLAEVFGARIDVLNVVEEGAIEHPDRFAELQNHFYSVLDRVVPQQARDFCDPRTFVEVGNEHDQILQHIKEHSIDILVLGIQKGSHLGMQMRTSRAFQLIVDADCPVLTIRQ